MRAANMQALTDDAKAEWPGLVVGGKGDPAHAAGVSDHNEDDTPGVRAEQSDADSKPEHRAIDLMLDSRFTAAEADALVARLLADPAALARLAYIIWNRHIWSRKYGWVRRAYTGSNPHTGHVHLSGVAADDENAAGWPAVRGAGMSNFCKRGDRGEVVKRLQLGLNRLIAGGGYGTLKPLTVDSDYGPATKAAVLAVLGGDGETYYAELDLRMDEKLAVLAARRAGLAGEKGEKGDAGDKGDKGDKGDDGAAAVLAPGMVLTVGEPTRSAALQRAIDFVNDQDADEALSAFQSFTG